MASEGQIPLSLDTDSEDDLTGPIRPSKMELQLMAIYRCDPETMGNTIHPDAQEKLMIEMYACDEAAKPLPEQKLLTPPERIDNPLAPSYIPFPWNVEFPEGDTDHSDFEGDAKDEEPVAEIEKMPAPQEIASDESSELSDLDEVPVEKSPVISDLEDLPDEELSDVEEKCEEESSESSMPEDSSDEEGGGFVELQPITKEPLVKKLVKRMKRKSSSVDMVLQPDIGDKPDFDDNNSPYISPEYIPEPTQNHISEIPKDVLLEIRSELQKQHVKTYPNKLPVFICKYKDEFRNNLPEELRISRDYMDYWKIRESRQKEIWTNAYLRYRTSAIVPDPREDVSDEFVIKELELTYGTFDENSHNLKKYIKNAKEAFSEMVEKWKDEADKLIRLKGPGYDFNADLPIPTQRKRGFRGVRELPATLANPHSILSQMLSVQVEKKSTMTLPGADLPNGHDHEQ